MSADLDFDVSITGFSILDLQPDQML